MIPILSAKGQAAESSTYLHVTHSRIYISSGNKLLITVNAIAFNFTEPTSVSLIDSSSSGYQLRLVYPATAKYQDNTNPLEVDLTVAKLPDGLHFTADPKWSQNVTIHLADHDEHYFGVLERLYPNNRKSPDLRGDVIDVDVHGDGNQYHENYSSVWSAFYMSSRGYASFFDTFAEGKYRFAKQGETQLYHHTGKLDWYVLPGANGDQMLQEYYKIIGSPKYIPVWACGPIVWRDQNDGGKDEILADIRHMTDIKIPLTGWFVDRPYSNGAHDWSKMDFNSKFANPKQWISEINNKYGLQFMTWVGPMTFADRDFPALLPNYKGYIDLTNPKGVNEFEKRLTQNQYAYNVRGHKMDRADEAFPEMAHWHDGTPQPEHRNKYIYLYAKTIDKFLRDSFGKDEFNFARAAFQRSQPYLSAVWSGDSRSSWDGLASSIANAVRTGFMGFPMWGSDTGGYLGGRIPAALYARWLEFSSWSGMFEVKIDNAGGRGEDRPPWKYGEQLQDIFRAACEHRMEMLPYIYSLANTSAENGVLMKPLAYVYPNDPNTYDIWSEYEFGSAFLVAPIYDSTNTRSVYLPEGKWYDYNNWSKTYDGNKTIRITEDLGDIPVFIKANSIYVTGNIYQGNDKIWKKRDEDSNIRITVVPGGSGSRTTFSYVDRYDHDNVKMIKAETHDNDLSIHADPIQSSVILQVKLSQKPKNVRVNNRRSRFKWDEKNGLVSLNLYHNKPIDIKINK